MKKGTLVDIVFVLTIAFGVFFVMSVISSAIRKQEGRSEWEAVREIVIDGEMEPKETFTGEVFSVGNNLYVKVGGEVYLCKKWDN